MNSHGTPTLAYAAIQSDQPLFSAAATAAVNMIPFHQSRPPAGLFDIGDFAALYFLLSFAQGFRLWWLMIHPLREENSYYVGPPLPFFRLLPGSSSLWFTRIVLEPVFLILLTWALLHLLIIQSSLATFFYLAALAMAMKNYIAWYRQWEFVRTQLDMKFVGPKLAKALRNEATNDELAKINMARLPKGLAPDVTTAAMMRMKQLFGAEEEH